MSKAMCVLLKIIRDRGYDWQYAAAQIFLAAPSSLLFFLFTLYQSQLS
ncbi:MAG: hypothetical protein LUG18_01635 [Candidatus Azobacteroides sp.]|nr:hypothetical protein [Candidatus Azobacteroides sp.]